MISRLLKNYKKIALINSLAIASSLGIFVFTCVYWWNFSIALVAAGVSTLVSLILTLSNKQFLTFKSSDFLEHINRHLPEYQESAQLLERNAALNGLQLIQKRKVEKLFNDDIANGRLKRLQPQYNFKLPLLLLVLSAVGFAIKGDLSNLYSNLNQTSDNNRAINKSQQKSPLVVSPPSIVAHKLSINSPNYTGIAPRIAGALDFEAIQGSTIEGQIEFSQPELEYYYSRSGKPATLMTKQGENFVFFDKVEQTSLYKFSYKQQDKLVEIDGIYTMTLVRDAAAKISITHPRTTLLEFKKSDSPQFTISADIKDDFGINDVRILASVAKGSGEAVKFRDKTFRFNASEITAYENSIANAKGYFKNASYKRTWNLTDLQMEPGDEAYFSLHVLDNKQPESQLTKSNSIIVRWLDEDEIELALEGIQIRFIPEYFRSQRQIIIETEQLIADSKDLSREKFENISTDLGRSQSDLKQKYGQYLGDEFGEGQGAQLGLADGYHGGETMSSGEASAGLEHADEKHANDQHHDEDEHHHDDEHHNEQQSIEAEHVHQDHESDTDSTGDLSGAQQLIEQFAHNHSSVDVTPLSKKDPKSWMKMAVNEMWQAELHLMMSEPSKALPYEYSAYKYLKLARQADRIYAKRLGFEPPPVSEERRLTGELKAILEYDLSYKDTPRDDLNSQLFSRVFQLINQKQAQGNSSLSEEQQSELSKVSQKLLQLSEQRATLIKYAAIAEKLALTKNLASSRCSNCATELKAKLWQLITAPLSRPLRPTRRSGFSDKQRKSYLETTGKIHD